MGDIQHRSGHARNLSILILLALVITVPFIGKAFHIDDTFYLEITKAIIKDPARPFSFLINWYNILEPGFISLHPPLYSYILAPFYYLFGPDEVALHAVSILFVIISISSFYFICLELEIKPLYPSLVLLSVPLFSVGLNVMIDVPLIALALLSVLFFFRGCKRDSTPNLILSGIFLGMAILTKYSALALVLPMIGYAVMLKKKKALMAVFIGLLFFIGWNAYTYFIYGKIHFMSGPSTHPRLYKIFFFRPMAFILVIGMLLPYAIVFIRRGRALYIAIITGVVAEISYLMVNSKLSDFPNSVLVGAGMALGIYLLVAICKVAAGDFIEKKPVTIFMSMWILMVAAMNIFFTPFVAPRNVVFMFPAIIIILFSSELLTLQNRLKLKRVIIFMFILSFALGYVDYRFAESYQKAAKRIAVDYKDKDIWYLGHWGWQFYAEKEGFSQLSKLSGWIAFGDIVVIPVTVHKQKIPAGIKDKLKHVVQMQYKLSWLPLRTQGDMVRAGFYATEIFRAPYSVSFAPLEVFDIYEVSP